VTVSVAVSPDRFTLVEFDSARIAGLVTQVAEQVGLPDGTRIRVEIDEESPLGKTRLASLDPVTLEVESGAFEDAKRPRRLSDRSVVSVVGRLLFRARDRLDTAFGDPPPDDELSLREYVAWDTYAVGRCDRLGLRTQKERRRYHFRIRHGFTDVADEVFDALWDGEGLTWADIRSACERTAAVDDRGVKSGRGR
jgi:hypothetical protein